MDVPILGLLFLLPVNFAISADPQATLTRIWHILLSVSLFYTVIRLVRSRRNLPILILCLLALAIGTGLLGLFATDWAPSILLSFLNPIYKSLPRLSSILPRAGINKNTMGGVLAFFPGLLLSILWGGSAFKKLAAKYINLRNFHMPLFTLIGVLAFGLVTGVLFLTQSRGAWLGAIVGVYIFLVWKDKRFLWAIVIAVVALLIVVRDVGFGGLSGFMNLLDQGQDASVQGRLDIWTRVLRLSRDFAVSGVGLNALNPVYQTFFNPFLFQEPNVFLFHAHNTFLSIAIEMGIPALVLYVSLLSSFGAMAARAWKHSRSINRVLISGLVCGMISHQVFGLMDAFPLGKNLDIILWIYLALMTALFIYRGQMVRSYSQEESVETNIPLIARVGYLAGGLAIWLGFSVLVLSVSQWNIALSLALAVVAGVVLGILLVNDSIFVTPMNNLTAQGKTNELLFKPDY